MTKNYVILNLQIACSCKKKIPNKEIFQRWLSSFVPVFKLKSEITIRVVERKEIQELNFRYRGINKPTNVLSFPFEIKENSSFLGDIIICQEIVYNESIKFNHPTLSYWANIVIHSCLHLLNFSHDNDLQKTRMKNMEKKIIKILGYSYSF
ncbi:hypothetical protein AOQ88_00175 [Candidatus Riesia sp. GBBU]|nr:hypothetical protein AOQ88_00175 [Candidatus Riesia sp. GBBU]